MVNDYRVCPYCHKDEDTVIYDEELFRMLRLCEKCELFYEVHFNSPDVWEVVIPKRNKWKRT
jgi:hypothetical protein